jgi:proteasome lid subunit RPN8/RPN11
MTRLRLHPNLREQIHNEACAALPRECCGLVEGVRSGENVSATRLHSTRNIAAEIDRFEIDPEAHFAILRSVRAKGSDIVGCYHSHPNGRAMPSAWDLANVGEEGFVWLIYALTEQSDGELAAFVVSAGKLVSNTYESETL